MSSRREPLLWLQCLAIGAIPLELLMLRLVLAGADLGPVPGLERLLAWAIGGLAPAIWFWKHQPDWGSLLVVRRPLKGRDRSQQQLSHDLQALPVKVIAAAGVIPLLIVLWWIDASALLVADVSPFRNISRLGSLLLATPLLALLLWQWQQLVQASWLLIRPSDATTLNPTSTEVELQQTHLSFGLALLHLPPLDWTATPGPTTQTKSAGAKQSVSGEPIEEDSPDPSSKPDTSEASAEASPTDLEPSANADSTDADSPTPSDHQESIDGADVDDASVLSGTVEPEQSSEEHNSTNLNEEVGSIDSVSSAEPETHHEQTQPSGSEESKPDQPSEASPGGT